jgi:hypothetical protein
MPDDKQPASPGVITIEQQLSILRGESPPRDDEVC